MKFRKEILVAPLNWGLGHATRCIPIIDAIIDLNYKPILASDGSALELLKKEYPNLEYIELPSYNIKYSKKGENFKLKLIIDSPKVLLAIKKEHKLIEGLLKKRKISGIISDNRLGIYSKSVPSVFITHQINVLSGNTTWLSSKLHQRYIKKFTECWVPDQIGTPNLSGKLGHSSTRLNNLKYIGPLSRFEKIEQPITYHLLVILSGPEPQRTFLENKLMDEFINYEHKILLVRGVVEDKITTTKHKNITLINYMTTVDLEQAINQSDVVLCRSGYTTIMDLAKLEKKAFFIPTPGQFEQEYLAKNLEEQGLVPYCDQDQFSLKELERVKLYSGLKRFDYQLNYKKLFSLFERE